MSEEMKEYLGQVTEKHGFHTRMAVPCRWGVSCEIFSIQYSSSNGEIIISSLLFRPSLLTNDIEPLSSVTAKKTQTWAPSTSWPGRTSSITRTLRSSGPTGTSGRAAGAPRPTGDPPGPHSVGSWSYRSSLTAGRGGSGRWRTAGQSGRG